MLVGLPKLWSALAPSPEGAPHPTVPGFTLLDGGAVSAQPGPFVGIIAPNADRVSPRDPPDLCAALFPRPTRPGTVPMAFFTDVNCPYCRVMEKWLTEFPERATLSWHDLPLLGESSLAAARAIAAAEMQGAGFEMRHRLTRTRFQPDDAYLRDIARGMGLESGRLLHDMTSSSVERRIGTSLGLAARFGIAGTPALVVGRTVAIGARDRAEVDALITRASRAPDDLPCPG